MNEYFYAGTAHSKATNKVVSNFCGLEYKGMNESLGDVFSRVLQEEIERCSTEEDIAVVLTAFNKR